MGHKRRIELENEEDEECLAHGLILECELSSLEAISNAVGGFNYFSVLLLLFLSVVQII